MESQQPIARLGWEDYWLVRCKLKPRYSELPRLGGTNGPCAKHSTLKRDCFASKG